MTGPSISRECPPAPRRRRAGFPACVLILLAAILAVAAPARAAPDEMESALTTRTQPSTAPSLIGRFNPADHQDRLAKGAKPKPSLFLDLRHEVEVEAETWHGSAGVQFKW